MSRNYERDERERWRRQQQNRQGQNRWSESGREDDYGCSGQGQNRDWRGDEPYGRDFDRGQQMGGEYRRQGMQGQWGNPNEREMWEGGGQRNWQGSDRGWDRENDWQGGRGGSWQGDRGQGDRGQGDRGQGDRWQGGGYQGRNWENEYRNEPQYGPGGGWNERYEGGSQRMNWNQGMGGGWNQNQETGRWNEGRNEGMHSGRGPRGYKRADNRIEEDINERLTQHGMIDASDVEVGVQNGEVTLRGSVDRREAKRLAEDIAESIFGVKEVHNQIRVKQRGEEETRHETDASGKPRDRKAS